MKTCTKCGETKPYTDFHRNPSGKDGLLAFCAECKNKARRKHKTCTHCGETKPYTDFNRNPMMNDGHVNQCKPCKKKQDRERYLRRKALPDNNQLLAKWGRP